MAGYWPILPMFSMSHIIMEPPKITRPIIIAQNMQDGARRSSEDRSVDSTAGVPSGWAAASSELKSSAMNLLQFVVTRV